MTTCALYQEAGLPYVWKKMSEFIIKISGIFLILGSSAVFSIALLAEWREKIRFTKELLYFVGFIRENIEYLKKPLPAIFESYKSDCLEKTGFLPMARRSGFAAAWKANRVKTYAVIDEVMSEFSKNIGKGYLDEEVRLCKYTEERLSDIVKKLEKEQKNKEKLYKTIPVMIALSVVLILI